VKIYWEERASHQTLKSEIKNKVRKTVDITHCKNIYFTVILSYSKGPGVFNLRYKMENLLERLTAEEPRIVMQEKGETINGIKIMENAKLNEIFSLSHNMRSHSVFMKVGVLTRKSWNGLKHDNDGRLVKWLKEKWHTLRINR